MTELLFDFELEVALTSGKSIKTIGFSPSPEEAVSRVKEIYGGDFIDAVVRRITVEHAPRNAPLIDLMVVWENDVFSLVDTKGRPAASEPGGSHLFTAWEFLIKENRAAKWKTLILLKTLRQAIREDTVSCEADYVADLLSGRPTRDRVAAFLAGARIRDRVHHGANTF